MAEHAKPNLPASPATTLPATDNFRSDKLGLQWQWNANHRDDWHSLTARPGWLRLYSQPAPAPAWDHAPHLLLQKFPAPKFAAETRIEFSAIGDCSEAGLVIAGRQSAALALVRMRDGHQLIFRTNGATAMLAKLAGASARLRVQIADGGKCSFAFATDDGTFNAVEGTFQAQPGVWIGAKVGLYSSCATGADGGHADFDYFRFTAQ